MEGRRKRLHHEYQHTLWSNRKLHRSAILLYIYIIYIKCRLYVHIVFFNVQERHAYYTLEKYILGTRQKSFIFIPILNKYFIINKIINLDEI